MRVNVVYDRWPHHAKRSGYPLIAEALTRHAEVRRLAPRHPRMIPGWLTNWMAAQAKSPAYGPRAAERELVVAARLSLGLPEICHFLYAEQNYRFAAALSPRRRGAIVCTYHLAQDDFDWAVPDRAFVASSDAVVVVSEHQAEMLRGTVSAELVHVVPLGVDTSYYRPEPGEESHRAIFVGAHGRDFDVLSEVAARCREIDPELQFEVISTDERVSELSTIANVRARSGVPDEELVRSYRRADLLLLPLRSATANNALLEGMSCGLPVIATDVGGVREYVDEHCALLVGSGDSEEMARAVLDLMHDRSRRKQMGLASRRRALRFDWANIADLQFEVYRDALSRSEARRAVSRRRVPARSQRHRA